MSIVSLAEYKQQKDKENTQEERLERIRNSLGKINALMEEIKTEQASSLDAQTLMDRNKANKERIRKERAEHNRQLRERIKSGRIQNWPGSR